MESCSSGLAEDCGLWLTQMRLNHTRHFSSDPINGEQHHEGSSPPRIAPEQNSSFDRFCFRQEGDSFNDFIRGIDGAAGTASDCRDFPENIRIDWLALLLALRLGNENWGR